MSGKSNEGVDLKYMMKLIFIYHLCKQDQLLSMEFIMYY